MNPLGFLPINSIILSAMRKHSFQVIPIWLCVLIILYCSPQLICTATGQSIRSGDLHQFISNVHSAMPGSGSNGFIVPTGGQIDTFRTIIDLVLGGEYFSADSLAHQLNYVLYEWTDTAQPVGLYYVLAEESAEQQGSVQLGWGLWVFNTDGLYDAVVEVPHPIFDYNTWRFGFEVYRRLDSRFFILAGAHRYSNGTDPRPADVAHNTQNMFHVLHQVLSPLSSHSVQIHGFSRNNHPGYPDIILSNGKPDPSSILDSISAAFVAGGFSVGIFNGVDWTALGATTNTQGQWSNSNNLSFVHIELEYFIRSSSAEREKAYSALEKIFRQQVGVYERGIEAQVRGFALRQNYPNPFNAQTVVNFFLDATMEVNLEIYDLHGRRVRSLFNGARDPGEYNLTWNAKNDANESVGSGIYIIMLRVNDSSELRKAVLLK